jgi:nucleoside-diphosphate-sugar epimerase
LNVTVFGATGPSGQLVVERALAAGHAVTAFARNPGKLTATSERLRVVAGELSDATRIEEAVAGAEAVISLLGPSGRTAGTPVTDGTRSIVAAMERRGVRRLIATATPSDTDPDDGSSWSFSLAVWLIRVLVGSAYEEIVGTARVVRESSLDWTLVRLPMLTDKPAPAGAVAGYVGDARIRLFSLSRAAMADFLVSQLADSTWIRKAPVVSNL